MKTEGGKGKSRKTRRGQWTNLGDSSKGQKMEDPLLSFLSP